jgi:hypothetical protein
MESNEEPSVQNGYFRFIGFAETKALSKVANKIEISR